MSARHRARLRMTPADYEQLQVFMLDTSLEYAETERQRWDALNAACDANPDVRTLLCRLYNYLTDAHIDSALRHIVAGSAIY